MTNYSQILQKLSKSKFRSSFHLKQKDFEYIDRVGIDKIKSHAFDFVTKKLAPAVIANDGKQTATHGHPVFVAQHATATCCRGCLSKWHKIEQNRALTPQQVDFVVGLIMAWIENQIEIHNQSKI